MEVDLSKEGHTGCPRCISQGKDNSRNNMMIYGLDADGEHLGGKCFSCGYVIPSVKWLRENSEDFVEENDWEELVGSEFNPEVHKKLKEQTGIDTRGYRGIRTDISKYFGVRYTYNQETGEVEDTYYPNTKDYQCVGYKQRTPEKKFYAVGEVGKDCEMFGQFRFKTFTDTVLFVGGEHDQLAAYQMLADAQRNKNFNPPAVVSSCVGETAAFKQAQLQYEFFNQFKKIVVALDADKAGEAATKTLIEVLPKGKVFIMKMRVKDPNQYLVEGKEKEFINDFWAAKPYTPDGVKSAADGFDEIVEELRKERITLPPYMHRMQEMMGGGIIQGRIANIIADTSTGKSTHVNRLVFHAVFHSPVIPTIISLEATAAQYMIEMLSIYCEQNMRWKMSKEEFETWLQTEECAEIKQKLCFREDGTSRFFILDDRSGSIKDLEAELEMLFRKHDSKLFIVDVLSDLLRGSSEAFAEDHMNFQRNMVKNGATFINVLHTRKPTQNADGTVRKVTEYDALGTGSFVQSAAYNIVLNRNKLSDNPVEKNTTEVDLPKCRGGKTGSAGKWYYDFNTTLVHDAEDFFNNPDNLTEQDGETY